MTLSRRASGALTDQLTGADAVVVLADGPQARELDERTGGALTAALAAVGSSGKPGTVVRVPLPEGAGFASAVVVAGERLEAAANGVRAAADAAHVLVAVDAPAEALYLAGVLATYRFEAFKTDPMATATVSTLTGDELDLARLDDLLVQTCFARDLVSLPSADKVPHKLVELIRAAAEQAGAECTVHDVDALESLGTAGLLAVGQGSVHAPFVVRLHAPGEGNETVAVVGKGLTYDSGGINIKLAMQEIMKLDMGGAAAAAAAVLHAARFPRKHGLTAWLVIAENVMSGSAYRPGDVLRMRSGLTVEVLNTDAEGRLALADGLSLAAEEQPRALLTIATLTGNAMSSLGLRTAGLMTSDDGLQAAVQQAAASAGESFWAMPHLPYLAQHLESGIADLNNLGDPKGQMMIAALFLARFAPEGVPFAHLDIAGPAFNPGKPYAHVPAGGTGFGVATLVELLDTL